MRDIHKQSYYELLEIEPSASQEEILKAYNRARATYGNNSPALYSVFNKEEAQELLKLIDEAYAILSNQFKRKQYDQHSLQPNTPATTTTPVYAPNSEGDRSSPENTGSFAIPTSTFNYSIEQPILKKTSPTYQSQQQELQDSASGSDEAQASTRFGKYKVDSQFEAELKAMEDFPGFMIQKIRLYKNISVDQIAETTKISRTYIAAIETSDYPCLPAPVFIRGFLVQVSKILGLDSNKVAASYLKIMKESRN